jgi:hypothetical protein
MGRRKGIDNDSDNVLEMYYEGVADYGRYNYLFLGRKGTAELQNFTDHTVLHGVYDVRAEVNRVHEYKIRPTIETVDMGKVDSTKEGVSSYIAGEGKDGISALAFLVEYIVFSKNANKGVVAISISDPAIATFTDHGLLTGDKIQFTTSGVLPTGLLPSTDYYVIRINDDTFNLSTTYANSLSGITIITTGAQSGIHTLFSLSPSFAVGDTISGNASNATAKIIYKIDSNNYYCNHTSYGIDFNTLTDTACTTDGAGGGSGTAKVDSFLWQSISPLYVTDNLNITAGNHFIPDATDSYDIGSLSSYFLNGYIRNLHSSSIYPGDIYLYDYTTGGTNPPTGLTDHIYMQRSDDLTQKFSIQHRAGINYDDENAVEMFYKKDANGGKYNYLFLGRDGTNSYANHTDFIMLNGTRSVAAEISGMHKYWQRMSLYSYDRHKDDPTKYGVSTYIAGEGLDGYAGLAFQTEKLTFSGATSFAVGDTITGNVTGATAKITVKSSTTVFYCNHTSHGIDFNILTDNACTTDGAGGGSGTGVLGDQLFTASMPFWIDDYLDANATAIRFVPSATDYAGTREGLEWYNSTLHRKRIKINTGNETVAFLSDITAGKLIYDAIVAPSGGDYTTLSAAITAGKVSIYVRGTINETATINASAVKTLVFESGATIDFGGGNYFLYCNGSSGTHKSGLIWKNIQVSNSIYTASTIQITYTDNSYFENIIVASGKYFYLFGCLSNNIIGGKGTLDISGYGSNFSYNSIVGWMGNLILDSATYNSFSNVNYNGSAIGIVIGGMSNCWHNYFSNCNIKSSDYALFLGTGGTYSYALKNSFSNCYFESTGKNAVQNYEEDNKFNDCTAVSSGGCAYNFYGSSGVYGGSFCNRNSIIGGSATSTKAGGYSAIKIEAYGTGVPYQGYANDNFIEGVRLASSSGYGIEILHNGNGHCDNTMLSQNFYDTCSLGNYSDGGTGTVINEGQLMGKSLVNSLSSYANNAAAIAGGLVAGQLYRSGGDPDIVAIVH